MFTSYCNVVAKLTSTVIPVLYTSLVLTSSNTTLVFNMKFHTKARTLIYPRSDSQVQRFVVPDDKVEWSEDWLEYKPTDFTSKTIHGQPWADPEISDPEFKPKWNVMDGLVNRMSHIGDYALIDSVPRNPKGRTGLIGRGILGRWGPNHAADPIVTRWKRDAYETLMIDHRTSMPILQFVSIMRGDTKEWALPGGMVDPGENTSTTLQREFGEEALNSLQLTEKEKRDVLDLVEKFFKGGIEMYKGYVDDPRNTDNAWMETIAVNYHDDDGDCVAKFPLNAGDDAVGVRWMDLSSDLQLYASHAEMLHDVAKFRKAHW